MDRAARPALLVDTRPATCYKEDIKPQPSFCYQNNPDSARHTGKKKPIGLVCSNRLRLEILFRHRGCCFVCGREEWRLKASLHMHRLIKGKDVRPGPAGEGRARRQGHDAGAAVCFGPRPGFFESCHSPGESNPLGKPSQRRLEGVAGAIKIG